MSAETAEEGNLALILDEKGNSYLLHLTSGVVKVTGLGTVDSGRLIGRKWGELVEIGGQGFTLIEPSLIDKIESIQRKAQIILPKDSALIVLNCDIKSGSNVVEIGAGSGALTIALASFVAPGGKVVSYEKRDDFADVARKNIRRTGLERYAQVKVADATAGIEERGIDSAVIDIPNPWDVVDNAYKALKLGGHLASYSPTFNQVELTVKKLRERGFSGVRSIETLLREIVVHDMGTRPSFDMLGHSGYLTFARKVK